MTKEVLACKTCIMPEFWNGFSLISFKSKCKICNKVRKCILISLDKTIIKTNEEF